MITCELCGGSGIAENDDSEQCGHVALRECRKLHPCPECRGLGELPEAGESEYDGDGPEVKPDLMKP